MKASFSPRSPFSRGTRKTSRSAGLRAVAGFVSFLAAGEILAQDAVLTLGRQDVLPGSNFSLYVQAQLNLPIRGFQFGIEFPQYAMRLLKFSFDGTAIGRKPLEVFYPVITSSGHATIQAILDNTPPFQNDIPSGTAVKLVRLDFSMEQGLKPGSEFPILLKSNLGIPPVPALIYRDGSSIPPVTLVNGAATVINDNYLKIRDLEDVVVGQTIELEVAAFNIEPLQGFSLAVKFDPARLQVLGAGVEDTITEAVGAEYVAPKIDNNRGILILGVLLDTLPPFENQVIPASGLNLAIAKVQIQVVSALPDQEFTEVVFQDGAGEPPIRNLFIVNNLSVEPRKENGRLSLLLGARFIRGDANDDEDLDISDPIRVLNFIFFRTERVVCQKAADANDDGRLDISDAFYILNYLFKGGPILPQPYPNPGVDPTRDDLPCNK